MLCPFPAVTIIPAFLLERIYPLAIAAPVVLFFLWNPGLSFGESVPKRSLVLLIVLTVPSLIYFVEFWAYGVEYQGGLYTKSICIINVTWLAGLWLIWLRSFRLPTYGRNVLFHWLLFIWLAWYAFPYLGELP